MQIIKEGEMWLAPQKVAAAYFGVSIQAFQKWDYESVRREGRTTLYDIRAIQNALDDRRSETAEDLDLTAERARLAKEQADKTEMENAARRGELVEAATVRQVVGTAIQSAKTRLLAVPSQIARYLENQTAHNIETQLNDAIHDCLTELDHQPFGDVEAAKKANGQSVGGYRKATQSRIKRTAGEVAN